MSDLNKFSALVDDIWEMVFGTIRRPEVKFKGMMTKEKSVLQQDTDFAWFKKLDKPKRARGKKGKFLADDKSTAYTNEAWVGGKAPKRGKK